MRDEQPVLNPKDMVTVGDCMLYWTGQLLSPDLHSRDGEVAFAIHATLCWVLGAVPPECPSAVEFFRLLDRNAEAGSRLRKALLDSKLKKG